MKTIIYATGRVFQTYKDKIKWEHVVAIADQKDQAEQPVEGYRLIKPAEINQFEYDYIAVFSNSLFENIRNQLVGDFFIPKEKIISWRDIVAVEWESAKCYYPFWKQFFSAWGYKRILDIGMSKLPKSCLNKEELLGEEGSMLDGVLSDTGISCKNVYDHVYGKISDCQEHYDAALIWNPFSVDEKYVQKLMEKTDSVIFYTSYLLGEKSAIGEVKKRWERYGDCDCFSNAKGILWHICFKKRRTSGQAKIYVVIHKKYNLKQDKLYQPICVGGFRQGDWLTESEGQNIAHLNGKINECTALYWIWKNTDTPYVGLNHYRRYFYNNALKSMDNYLNAGRIDEIMDQYDLILPETFPLETQTVYQQIHSTINSELCEKAYDLLRRKIHEHQPEYLEAFDSVMAGYNMFWCNIFVAKREVLNRYCEWLFSFLIPAAEEIDVTGYDSYSQRVMGFFAERMWTVWLRKNKVKIKQLPFVIPDH